MAACGHFNYYTFLTILLLIEVYMASSGLFSQWTSITFKMWAAKDWIPETRSGTRYISPATSGCRLLGLNLGFAARAMSAWSTIDGIEKSGRRPAFIVGACANENKYRRQWRPTQLTIISIFELLGIITPRIRVYCTYLWLWCTTNRHSPFSIAPRCRPLSSTPPNVPWRNSRLGKWIDCPVSEISFVFGFVC